MCSWYPLPALIENFPQSFCHLALVPPYYQTESSSKQNSYKGVNTANITILRRYQGHIEKMINWVYSTSYTTSGAAHNLLREVWECTTGVYHRMLATLDPQIQGGWATFIYSVIILVCVYYASE